MGSALYRVVEGGRQRGRCDVRWLTLIVSSQLVPESQRVQWAMHEVLSPETWRQGRVTLLGDSVRVGWLVLLE